MYLPDWIQKYKEPRTEIKRIKNAYYKYEVAFVYSKKKKRTEKKPFVCWVKSQNRMVLSLHRKMPCDEKARSCHRLISKPLAFIIYFQR